MSQEKQNSAEKYSTQNKLKRQYRSISEQKFKPVAYLDSKFNQVGPTTYLQKKMAIKFSDIKNRIIESNKKNYENNDEDHISQQFFQSKHMNSQQMQKQQEQSFVLESNNKSNQNKQKICQINERSNSKNQNLDQDRQNHIQYSQQQQNEDDFQDLELIQLINQSDNINLEKQQNNTVQNNVDNQIINSNYNSQEQNDLYQQNGNFITQPFQEEFIDDQSTQDDIKPALLAYNYNNQKFVNLKQEENELQKMLTSCKKRSSSQIVFNQRLNDSYIQEEYRKKHQNLEKIENRLKQNQNMEFWFEKQMDIKKQIQFYEEDKKNYKKQQAQAAIKQLDILENFVAFKKKHINQNNKIQQQLQIERYKEQKKQEFLQNLEYLTDQNLKKKFEKMKEDHAKMKIAKQYQIEKKMKEQYQDIKNFNELEKKVKKQIEQQMFIKRNYYKGNLMNENSIYNKFYTNKDLGFQEKTRFKQEYREVEKETERNLFNKKLKQNQRLDQNNLIEYQKHQNKIKDEQKSLNTLADLKKLMEEQNLLKNNQKNQALSKTSSNLTDKKFLNQLYDLGSDNKQKNGKFYEKDSKSKDQIQNNNQLENCDQIQSQKNDKNQKTLPICLLNQKKYRGAKYYGHYVRQKTKISQNKKTQNKSTTSSLYNKNQISQSNLHQSIITQSNLFQNESNFMESSTYRNSMVNFNKQSFVGQNQNQIYEQMENIKQYQHQNKNLEQQNSSSPQKKKTIINLMNDSKEKKINKEEVIKEIKNDMKYMNFKVQNNVNNIKKDLQEFKEKVFWEPNLNKIEETFYNYLQNISQNYLYITRMIENHRYLVHTKFKNKDTVLHLACKNNDLQLFKFLMQNGADIEIRNQVGKKPKELGKSSFIQAVEIYLQQQQEIIQNDGEEQEQSQELLDEQFIENENIFDQYQDKQISIIHED